MGHPASPLLAELFMADFETRIEQHPLFPRIWIRYVDDIFAIIKKNTITTILDWLNGLKDSIKFTHETEKDGKMPFLDVEVMRIENNKLGFKIYRKPTNTCTFINAKSFHCSNHKYAAFNSMVFRACSIPMSDIHFEDEINFIRNVAIKNGFGTNFLNGMIKRHQRNIHRSETTTLSREKDERVRFIGMTYFPKVTDRLKNVFHENGLAIAYRSNNKIKSNLLSTKDKIDKNDRSGIYEVKCGTENCNKVYVGQTQRAARVRFKEHKKCIDSGTVSNSAIAQHVVINEHDVRPEDFRLIKEANGFHRLNTLEAIHIHKHKNNALNRNDGITHSILYDLC